MDSPEGGKSNEVCPYYVSPNTIWRPPLISKPKNISSSIFKSKPRVSPSCSTIKTLMNYFDLNIPYNESDPTNPPLRNTRLKTVVKSLELGYSAIAYNHTIKSVISDKHTCTIHRFPLPSLLKLSPNLSSSVKFHRELLGVRADSPFRQYSRLTVCVDHVVQFNSLCGGSFVVKSYDLVAVRPLNQDTFDYACEKSEVDIIAIDFTKWVPFMVKFPMLELAIKRGIYFEITYSHLIGDLQVRRQMIQSTKILVQWTRGKNLIFSSAAASATEIRGPSDVANLASLLGISIERAKAAISKNCRCLLANAIKKKQYYRSAIKVDRISTTDPVDSAEAWFGDGHGWDNISSGNGDLLLDDIAKSFAASSKAPQISKSIDFASNSKQKPLYGVQVQDYLCGSGSKVHPAFSKFPANDFGSSDRGPSIEELKGHGGDSSAGRLSVNGSPLKKPSLDRQGLLKESSGSNSSAVIIVDKGIGTSFEEGNISDSVVPVAGVMMSLCETSEECGLKGVHVTAMKEIQASEFHADTTGSSNPEMMPPSLNKISTNENKPVVAQDSGKNYFSSDEMPSSFCCNANATRTNDREVEMSVDHVTMMGELSGREVNGNSDTVLSGCDMSMDRGNSYIEKLGHCNDPIVPHLDNRILGDSSYERQSDANFHSEFMSPQSVPFKPRITSSGRSRSRHRGHIPAFLLSHRRLWYSTIFNKKYCSQKGKNDQINWESGVDSNMKDRFVELCLQELVDGGKSGGTLKPSSWTAIAKEIKNDFGDCYKEKQLKKKMKIMKKQYHLCASITNKIGHRCDATGNSTISSPEMRSKYHKARLIATQLRF